MCAFSQEMRGALCSSVYFFMHSVLYNSCMIIKYTTCSTLHSSAFFYFLTKFKYHIKNIVYSGKVCIAFGRIFSTSLIFINSDCDNEKDYVFPHVTFSPGSPEYPGIPADPLSP